MSDLRSNKNASRQGEQSSRQWQRWQMAELTAEPVPARKKRSGGGNDGLPLTEAQRREQLREEARETGLEDGRQAGFEQGLNEGREQGHAEGYDAGLAEGRARAETELETRTRETLQPLHALMQGLEEARECMDDEIAKSMVELALNVGQQLARQALDARPEVVLDIVRELLHSEPALTGKPRLWLHPEDLHLVEERLGNEISAAGWQLQPDDALQRGGCRLISSSGGIDASWEERVASVCRQVRKPRRRRQTTANNKPRSGSTST